MFSYYGSKSKVVRLYQPPSYDRIIEPFAGSARYACLYYTHDVWINDSYPVIYRLWKFIQGMNRADVESLPELDVGQNIRNLKQLSDDERLLLGFCVGMGRAEQGYTATPRACDTPLKNSSEVYRLKKRLRKFVGRISHWKITCLDYRRIGNVRATWFIDPPYEVGGYRYKRTGIDYTNLLRWIQTRRGETITCENTQNTWLDYADNLAKQYGCRFTTTEVVRYGKR